MTDRDREFRNTCISQNHTAQTATEMLYHVRSISHILECELDNTRDLLNEASGRLRQCQLGRDELERENRSLRNRLDRIDQDNEDVINMLTTALDAIPEEVDQVLDLHTARDYIDKVMKIINPPATPAPF